MVQIGNGAYAIMHGDIALNGVSAWLVNRHGVWCVIEYARLNGTTSNRVSRTIEMVKKMCAMYQQVGIDPPSGERPANYGQT